MLDRVFVELVVGGVMLLSGMFVYSEERFFGGKSKRPGPCVVFDRRVDSLQEVFEDRRRDEENRGMIDYGFWVLNYCLVAAQDCEPRNG